MGQLRPKIGGLGVGNGGVEGKGGREERRRYIEEGARRVVRRGAGGGGEEIGGERRGREEVVGLEWVVGGLGRGERME